MTINSFSVVKSVDWNIWAVKCVLMSHDHFLPINCRMAECQTTSLWPNFTPTKTTNNILEYSRVANNQLDYHYLNEYNKWKKIITIQIRAMTSILGSNRKITICGGGEKKKESSTENRARRRRRPSCVRKYAPFWKLSPSFTFSK